MPDKPSNKKKNTTINQSEDNDKPQSNEPDISPTTLKTRNSSDANFLKYNKSPWSEIEIRWRRTTRVRNTELCDNGLNTALGFSQSFSSNFYCRFCKENKNTLRTKADSNSIVMRNIENYNADLLIGNASLTGVSEESVFNIAPHFHAVENFSVDIMHDLFEGVFNYHMSSIILFFIENSNLFTLETLNNRKQTFQYGETEIGNISPPIKLEDLRKYKFKMSAREMLCFVHHFSLMVGDLVPLNDAVWDLFLLLLKFLDLVMMPSVNADIIRLTKATAEELNSEYIRLFKEHLRPKHHFLLHYDSIIEQSGPLTFLSCMRFEAKHREMKLYSNNTTSRKNLPLSLGIKNQLKSAYRLLSQHGLPEKTSYSHQKLISNLAENAEIICLKEHGCLDETKQYFEIPKIVYKGTTLKRDYFLAMLNISSNKMQIFQIKNFLVDSIGIVTLICNEFEINAFENHFQSYEIGDSIGRFPIQINKIVTPPVHPHTISNGKKYLRYKHY